MARLVSGVDESAVNLLQRSGHDSVPHSRTQTANPVHVMKSAGEFVHRSRVCLDNLNLSNIWKRNQGSLISLTMIGCRIEKKGMDEKSNKRGPPLKRPTKKKLNNRPVHSPPTHTLTSLSCTNTTPLGTVMFSEVIIVIRSVDTKGAYTDTHKSISLRFTVPSDMKSKHANTIS